MRNGCFGFSAKRCWQTRKGKIINFYDINKIMFRDWFFRLRPVSHPTSYRIVTRSSLRGMLKFQFANAWKKKPSKCRKSLLNQFLFTSWQISKMHFDMLSVDVLRLLMMRFICSLEAFESEAFAHVHHNLCWCCRESLISARESLLNVFNSLRMFHSHSLMALWNIACCMNIKNQPAQCLTRIFAPKAASF